MVCTYFLEEVVSCQEMGCMVPGVLTPNTEALLCDLAQVSFPLWASVPHLSHRLGLDGSTLM